MANKYIDADRLKAEIEGIRWFPQISSGYNDGREDMKMMVLDIIDSLQQEQPQVADASKMEQPEVELEKEIDAVWNPRFNLGWDEHSALSMNHAGFASIARHFYGLRNRALEESARHVYESWMGSTMDDVRRDMIELGKVLNARKEK